MNVRTSIPGEWVILGYGRPADDIFMGPGTHDEIMNMCLSWNDSQTEREQAYGDYARGTLQRFYIKRAAAL
ncbi:hypothetical protein [Streptomyces sp. SP17KL33]|uniref:hypothetical protein n=1 Tax=Streptomyces sp. SP17KL33 TaxID=3002534 RepID=UPI002E78BAE1|nr:hypothetical protein [Streptomyces sp. SP17KL33]MEE1835783.1 hypothetical protein [Streptomyces sp. SP17KL33]